MKQSSILLSPLLAAVVLAFVFAAGLPGAVAGAAPPAPTPLPQAACDSNRTVQVNGAATIHVVPDRVLIQLGVQSNGASTTAVQSANTAAIQKVLKALQARGVAARDIATDIYVIEPIYEDYDSLYIKGYRINNLVAVTLRDVKSTGPVLAAALEAGANQVVNVEFYTSELRKYRDQARTLAMQAAREKAQALASAADARAGCVLSIHENSWSYYNGWWPGRSSGNWAQNVVQNAAPGGGSAPGGADEPLSLGQISIQAEVGATFALE
jgi:hypothetical protein